MTKFYRKEEDPDTIYQSYNPKTGQFSDGIPTEAKAQELGVIPDWEASWKPSGASTNIETISPSSTNLFAQAGAQIKDQFGNLIPKVPNIFGGTTPTSTPTPTPQPTSIFQQAVQQNIQQPTSVTPTPTSVTPTPGIATNEDVRNAYTAYIGREPTEAEYTYHSTNQTGLNVLNEWAMKQEWEGVPVTPTGTAAPVVFPEGTLVRAEGDDKVYVINPDGTRAHVPDSETLNKLYGTGAWANIKPISFGELQEITETTALTSETAGAQEGTTRVNPQTGKREVFQGGTWNPTETFDVEASDTIPADEVTADTVLPPDAYRAIEEGELVSAEGAPKVYLSQDGVLRHIPSPSEFEKMGYKWEDIRQVAPQLIAGFKKGTPITQLIQQIDESVSTYQSIIDEAKASSQVGELETEQKGWREKITDTLAGIGDALTKWWEDPSITNKEAAITEGKEKIANLQKAKQTALNISKNRLESTAFISGEQEQIKDRMNIEIALEQSMLGILQDDLEIATEKAKWSVDLAIKQEELKLTAMQQALAFVEADLSREDQEVANKMQFALIQYQSELEQVKADAQNRANTYAQITASYGMVPGLDPSMSVTEQWALAAPKAQQVFDAKLAGDTSGIDESNDFDFAYLYAGNNPSASYDELLVSLMQGTDLNNSEIGAILRQAGRSPNEIIYTDADLTNEVEVLMKEQEKFWGKGSSREKEKERAIKEIKNYDDMSPAQRNQLTKLINDEYYYKYGIGEAPSTPIVNYKDQYSDYLNK